MISLSNRIFIHKKTFNQIKNFYLRLSNDEVILNCRRFTFYLSAKKSVVYEKMLSQTQKSATSVNDDRQEIDKLRKKISEYIKCKEKKRVDDSKTVRLLRRVYDACLRENAIIIDVTLALQSLLKIMNKRLSRIEEKDISKISKNSNQTETMIVERTSSAF